MSDSVASKLAAIAGKGNGLLARKDIEPGDVIFTVQNPYLALLNNASLENHCFECFLPPSPNINLRACTGCKAVYYCSKECQAASWKRGHKQDCKIYKDQHDKGRTLPTITRAMIAIMIQARKEPNQERRLADFGNMESHADELNRDPKIGESIKLQSLMVAQQLDLTPREEGLSRVVCCLLQVNAFQLIDHTETEIGILFDPYLALANHSCVPNAFIAVDGRKASLRAIHPIKEDEEICISYIDQLDDMQNRFSILKEKYRFECTCPRCNSNQTPYEVYRDFLSTCNSPPFLDIGLFASPPSTTDLETLCKKARLPPPPEPKDDTTAPGLLHLQQLLTASPPRPAKYPDFEYIQQLYVNLLTSRDVFNGFIFLAFKVTHLDPIRYPSSLHPNRINANLALSRLLAAVLDERAVSIQASHSPLLDHLDTLRDQGLRLQFALLNLAKLYGSVSFGPESRFVGEVKADLELVEKDLPQDEERAKLQAEFENLKVGGDGKEIVVARKLFETVREVGTLENVVKVVEIIVQSSRRQGAANAQPVEQEARRVVEV